MTTVSVVIPTFGRPSKLVADAVASLVGTYPDLEILVVHQGGPGEDVNGAQRIELPIVSLTLARNVGLRAVSGDVILYVDDDVIADPELVAAHARCYDDPAVGAVAGRIVSPADEALSHPSGAIGRVLPDGSAIRNFHLTERREVDFGPGANMSFRREALLRAGGFDERLNLFREENDAFLRVRRLGYSVVFEPDALLTHLCAEVGGAWTRPFPERMDHVFRSETLFFFNCMEKRNLPAFALRIARWMKATAHSNDYSLSQTLRMVRAPFVGVAQHYLERPDRLSRQLG